MIASVLVGVVVGLALAALIILLDIRSRRGS
jgi:hypothetical protein